MQENHSNLLKPANPILSLLNQNQEAETLPFPVNNNNPFLSSSRLNSNNPFKSSSSKLNAWANIWNSRSRDKWRDFSSQLRRTSRSSSLTLRTSRETLPPRWET